MTDQLFFDTDCISAFLWVDNESILSKLFSGRIVIPKEVYKELSHPGVNHIKNLKEKVDILVAKGDAVIMDIDIGTEEYELYRKMIFKPEDGQKIIGKGEAASIALAKTENGILASNNLKDILFYVKKYKLAHITTGDIMKMALENGYISEEEGNTIWHDMLSRRRKLGYKSFTDFLEANRDRKRDYLCID